jgi:hypothetical protein
MNFSNISDAILEAGMRLDVPSRRFDPTKRDGFPFILTLGKINNQSLPGFENHIEVYFPMDDQKTTEIIYSQVKRIFEEKNKSRTLPRTFSFTMGTPIPLPPFSEKIRKFQSTTSFALEKKAEKIIITFFSKNHEKYVDKEGNATPEFAVVQDFLIAVLGESLLPSIETIDFASALNDADPSVVKPIDGKLFRELFLKLIGQERCNFCDHTNSQTTLTPAHNVYFCSDLCLDRRLKTLENN